MSNTHKAKAARMSKLVARFYDTGQSVSDFCETNGIKQKVLRYWRHKFKNTLVETAPATVSTFSGFHEISVVSRLLPQQVVVLFWKRQPALRFVFRWIILQRSLPL